MKKAPEAISHNAGGKEPETLTFVLKPRDASNMVRRLGSFLNPMYLSPDPSGEELRESVWKGGGDGTNLQHHL